ncbi:MAG: DHH family phosphoesterase [Thermoprotei archaeon]
MNYSEDMERLAELTHKLVSVFKNYSVICLSTHRDADPDAVASVLGVKFIAESLLSNVRIGVVFPEGLNRVAAKIVKSLRLEGDLVTVREPCDLVVYVDASSKSQVSSLNTAVNPDYVVIDHHETNELAEGALLSIHLRNMGSTSELLTLMMELLSLKPGTRLATLLIAGILYDTKNLRLARPPTFRALYYLTRLCNECLEEAFSIMTTTEINRDEKIAVLKGISRAGLYELDKDFILAVTCVGAHESSVLKALITSGADVAVAISLRSGETRIYVRASHKIISVLGIPVASDLATYVARELKGSGGGHEGAAGLSLNYEVDVAEVLRLVRQFFTRLGMRVNILEEGRWINKCS